MAAGVWFTTKCGKDIPLPDAAPSFKPRATIDSRQLSCPATPEYIPLDVDDPIGSYVHFGDSYGAGMGTGTTSRDRCRVGSNNFGRLLYSYMNDASISYDGRVCSGDTLTGLSKQIDNWSNAGDASIGTLSVGGNDVGFRNLVYYFVINIKKFLPWFTGPAILPGLRTGEDVHVRYQYLMTAVQAQRGIP